MNCTSWTFRQHTSLCLLSDGVRCWAFEGRRCLRRCSSLLWRKLSLSGRELSWWTTAVLRVGLWVRHLTQTLNMNNQFVCFLSFIKESFVGDSIGGSDPHYQVFLELKGVRNLTEEQRYKVIKKQQRTSSSWLCSFLILSPGFPFPSSPVGRVPPAGLGRLQVFPYQRQHRTNEGAAGGRGSVRRTSQAHDGPFEHVTQHL